MGLETVELVLAWEEEFHIEITDADAEKCPTPRDVCDLVERKLASERRPEERSEIDRLVKLITLEMTGIKDAEFSFDARFIEDLGID